MARRFAASRAVTWLVLAGYVLVASGLPLPIASGPRPESSAAGKRLADKDRSRPFPCMDKPCGCATAEQCFTNCCCNSPAELLVWAKAHRLEPATLATLELRAAAAAPAPASCCAAKRAEPSCCTTIPGTDAASEPDVCRAFRSLAAIPQSEPPASPPECRRPAADDAGGGPAPPRPIPRTVSLRAMLACGGIVAGWSAMTTSLPPPVPVRCDVALPLVDRLVLADDVGLSPCIAVDTPPPRA